MLAASAGRTNLLLRIIILCLPSDNVSYVLHSDMSLILQYCSSLSPSTSVVSFTILDQQRSYFLLNFLLKAPSNTSLPLQTLADPTPRRHSIPTSLASVLSCLSLLFLAAWRSLSDSLYRYTRREIATWMVAEIIRDRLCRRLSLLRRIRSSLRQCLPLPGRLGR